MMVFRSPRLGYQPGSWNGYGHGRRYPVVTAIRLLARDFESVSTEGESREQALVENNGKQRQTSEPEFAVFPGNGKQ
jgi:hypothetical protein